MNRWYTPGKEGVYDKNNRGMGIDIVRNEEAVPVVQDRYGKWLTVQEERDLRNSHIDYANDVMDRHSKQNPALSNPNIRSMAAGVIYRGDGKKLWNNTSLGRALRSNDE